ncbi:hypothetical protein GQ44DRAFT_802803 [Phaeosphaeriaceae sp. PMI808]|nr:hypothetical protein GQ44DRAFT_802803 [Phaeosphaeriaceae sp. PMI808]
MADQYIQIRDREQATLDSLPIEIFNATCSNLGRNDIRNLALVSKKSRDLAQCILWRTIDTHHIWGGNECFELDAQKDIRRGCIQIRYHIAPEDYNVSQGHAFERLFGKRAERFEAVVRDLYLPAGQSQAWYRLASFVRHLSLTVTTRSPPQIWDAILSIPKLDSVEIISEHDLVNQDSRQILSQRSSGGVPAANRIRNVRLRGYIPAQFLSKLCYASASTITSLDLFTTKSAIFKPRYIESTATSGIRQIQFDLSLRALIWFDGGLTSRLSSLTHIHLCKRGRFCLTPDEAYEQQDILEYKQWASFLRSVRSTLVEITLEQRHPKLYNPFTYWEEVSHQSSIKHLPECNSFDSSLYHYVLKSAFDDRGVWPKLKKLTLRGFNLQEFHKVSGETLQVFAERTLPGVSLHEMCGVYMYFNWKREDFDHSTPRLQYLESLYDPDSIVCAWPRALPHGAVGYLRVSDDPILLDRTAQQEMHDWFLQLTQSL